MIGNPVLPFSEGVKGDFMKDTFRHVSHTLEKKLFTAWLDWDKFAKIVELQSSGTGKCVEPIVNSTAKNGLHLYEP